MRRKRLQHGADNLCQMFCGWRQTWSKHRLVGLGNGILELDVLADVCRFNGVVIEPLPILLELRTWFEEDLARHAIPRAAILEATVRVELTFDTVSWDERTTSSQFFWHGGEEARSDPMHRCVCECSSVVRTDEAEYRGKYRDREEWPIGWPAA